MPLHADVVVQVLLRERVRLTALAAGIARDAHGADDVFQQVAVAALEAAGGLNDTGHLLAWAARATRHRALDLARARRLRPLPAEFLDRLEARAASADPAWSDRGEALHRCLGRLAPAARGLLAMRYADGLSGAAIAARLGRTPDAVYQELSRLHRLLRACVDRRLAAERPAAPPPTREAVP